MPRIVRLEPHNPAWVRLYHEEAGRLAGLLSADLVAIHHIGSTSIPTIKAKPIIDLLVEVRDIGRIDAFNPQMEALGYTPMGEYGIPGRRFFYKGTEDLHTFHVHIFQHDNPEFQRHLNFRDYLIAHPNEARRYEAVKEELAEQHRDDAGAYAEAKTPYIRQIEKLALAWRAQQKQSG
jgi:GrpB-like predicted nucleotidyltransferase (UPF0157 family)